MNILITGGNGQLGNELADMLAKGKSELSGIPAQYNGAAVTRVDVDTLDITDLEALRRFAQDRPCDLILNCAAATNVDGCEADPDGAYRVNALGAGNLAMLAQEISGKLVHVSTDYVFPGDGTIPYVEWDAPAPNTVYGKSKLLGERYVRETCARSFIVRTSWLYGLSGNNFVKTMLRVGREKGAAKVVNDQIGNPTYTHDLAFHILKLAATEYYGLYHCTGEGVCSWYDFACEIFRLGGVQCDTTPCTTAEFPRPAPRPAYSALENMALRASVGNEMRDWKNALASYMEHYDRESGEIRP